MANHPAPTSHTDIIERLLTPEQAAKILRVKPRTLQAWRYRGGGPRFIKLGRRSVRYRRSDLKQYILDSLRRSTSDPGPDAA